MTHVVGACMCCMTCVLICSSTSTDAMQAHMILITVYSTHI